MDKRITVVLADANEEFRTALKQALEATGEFDVVGCAADGLAAAQDIAERKPQLLVMDLLLPGLDGFGVLEQAAKDKVHLELAAGLIAEAERHARIDDGLPLERVKIILHGDIDVREDLEVRLPVEQRAGLFAVGGLFLHLAVDLALFEVEVIFEAVSEDPRVEILRGILRGAGAEAVQAEAVFIIFAGVVVVFAARVHLAEDQLPVVALLLLVPVHRAAAAEVLDLDAAVGVARDDDELAIALARLVNGVRQDFKHGVFAAVQPVGAKNDRGALANALRAFERGNALVAVCLLFGHNVPRSAWFHDRDNKYSISRRLQNVKKSAKGRTRGIYYGYHSCSGSHCATGVSVFIGSL